jgi:hypothetical protein
VAGWLSVVLLCVAHGAAIWLGLGGWKGISSDWPIWRDDHPLYLHSALITRHFLGATGTTAGYDPAFMSGYAKSVVFPASSTLPELVVAALGRARPERAYKVYVLISAALAPWLIAWVTRRGRGSGAAAAVATLLFLLYVWTDFPINYVAFGMLPYFLAIPLGLGATVVFCNYLEKGGAGRWAASAAFMAVVVLVHLTSAMVVAPAAALAYLVAALQRSEPGERRFPLGRHVGVWAIPLVVLAANAFWWLPGIGLASTKGPSDFAFAHPEGVFTRLWQIVTVEAPAESLLWAAGLVGLAVLGQRDRVLTAALAGFVGAGCFWGYFAGGLRQLDFLQPGRHTFACYSALALAAGFGLSEVLARLREAGPGRLDRWALVGLAVVGFRLFGPALVGSVGARIDRTQPFLTSEPPPRLLWILKQVKDHMKPGERLLYEEGGFAIPGVPDPFQGGRFSGILPGRTGIELIGGPYLHAALKTNFVQFGENRLFGKERWGRDHFVRHARLYRPAYILCWSPWARGFCRANPDLIEPIAEDGVLLFGRVAGFPGAAIEGSAEVQAEPGRLIVRRASAGVDGTVVLRYHSVPHLSTSPRVWWEPVSLEDDPTPFIRLRPPAGPVTLEIRFRPDR